LAEGPPEIIVGMRGDAQQKRTGTMDIVRKTRQEENLENNCRHKEEEKKRRKRRNFWESFLYLKPKTIPENLARYPTQKPEKYIQVLRKPFSSQNSHTSNSRS
jgi:hypothetical protein